jgi:outer membrane receptor for ferrienterochelin and colicins
MKQIFLLCIALFIKIAISAQFNLRITIKVKEEMQPLEGAVATIISLKLSTFADSSGNVTFSRIPAGKYSIKISYAGKKEQEISVVVPQTDDIPVVLMEEDEYEEEAVIIYSTRMSRSIKDIPTRVETISGEELIEKGNMKPGDIRMILNESTGIQTQQTSATSYNSSIRIQGLDGRYTQILKDGFPLYSGFSGGLSLMQVTPLDLKQIEVIKGSSSTLYGGGAIAGLVNLVSKTPTAKELSFLANGTTAGGLDLSAFYRGGFKNLGITVFGSRNSNNPYDPADIGLTAIPKFERYTINPRIFLHSFKTTFIAGFNYMTENRIGGNMEYIKRGTAGYFEKNNTNRFTTQIQLTYQSTRKGILKLKNSYNHFKRTIKIPNYIFQGVQKSSYSEATYNIYRVKSQWIIGSNFLTEDFAEEEGLNTISRDYRYKTLGAFVQNTWNPSSIFSIETGVRGDYVKQFGFEFLPRFSAMMKLSPKLTTRLGGGLGYKTPTVFNEEAEKIQFQNILSINENNTRNERSIGGNFDINYRTTIGKIRFHLNQLFFYTRLNRPLILSATSGGQYEFINANGHIDTKGSETNFRFTHGDFKLFVGYTYADVNSHFGNVKNWFPLTARHRLNNVLMYEKEGKLKIGLEAYYFSPQKLTDGNIGRSYWIMGLMGEKIWKHFSVFLNFENFTDTRQTKFDAIYTGSIDNPIFRDIYAPVDGFVVNGGFKIRL